VTARVALAELLALSGSIAAVSATAVTVKLPAVLVRTVKRTVRASPSATSCGSQEMLLALTAQASPPASMPLTVIPAGMSIDRRASEVTLGPLFVIATANCASPPATRLAGETAAVVARSASGAVTISTEAVSFATAPSSIAITSAVSVSVPIALPVSDRVIVRAAPEGSVPRLQLAWLPLTVQLPPAAFAASSVEPAGTANRARVESASRVPSERTLKVSE